jgi:uncharacterized membrane protein
MSLFAALQMSVARDQSQIEAAKARSPVVYELRDLGSIDNVGQSEGTAINDAGEIVGSGQSRSGPTVPFYWSQRTGFIKILEGDVQGTTVDINERGQVAGWFVRNSSTVGFLWSRKNGLTELGTFRPIRMNDRGDIVGACDASNGVPCVWSSGILQRLDVPAGGFGLGLGINNRGDVVGDVNVTQNPSAALWRGGQTGFEILEPTPAAGYDSVLAYDINNRGIIVGRVERVGGVARHPVIWDRDRAPTVVDSTLGQLVGINNRGIGILLGENPPAGLVWDIRRSSLSVLPSLGGPDAPRPADINNRNQIVGLSSNEMLENHVILWERVQGRN